MDENKKMSTAEKAREDRKARIEKASQTQTEKKEKKASQSVGKKRAKIIIPIVILVLVIVAGFLYYFGIPQRTLSAVTLADGSKISVAEYEYYYKSIYNNYVNTAYQYDSYYGEGVGAMYTNGFDYTKTPSAQSYTGGDLDEKYGENPTWADFFEQSTVEQVTQIKTIYNAAVKAGYKLDKDEQSEIDKQIEELTATAKESNYTLNAYLLNNYARGMNEKMLRDILKEYAIIDKFDTAKQEEITDSVTADDIQAAYDKDPSAYKTLSLKVFYLGSTAASNTDDTNYSEEELAAMTKKSTDETVAKMQKFYDAATLDNFKDLAYEYAPDADKDNYKEDSATDAADIDKSTITQYFGEDAAKWVFGDGVKVGDKHLVKTENEDGSVSCYTIILKSAPVRDDTKQPINVRHILFSLTENVTDESGNAVTNEDGTTQTKTVRTMEQAKSEAQALLDQWVKDGAKEDDFVTLASEKSDDTGSSDNGGLIENVTKSSSYVKEFLNWCFADGRKVGDYGLVESQYGVHVMYMSSISDLAQWQTTIKNTLVDDEYNEFFNSIVDKDNKATIHDWLAGRVQNRVEDFAAKTVAAINAQKDAAATTAAASK